MIQQRDSAEGFNRGIEMLSVKFQMTGVTTPSND